jgi:hypothetical protein
VRTELRLALCFGLLLSLGARAGDACERLVVEYRRLTPIGTVSFDGPPQSTQVGTVCVFIADDGKTARWSIEWGDGKVYRSWILTPEPSTTEEGKMVTWMRLSANYDEEGMRGRMEDLTVVKSDNTVALSGMVIILDERLVMSWRSNSAAQPSDGSGNAKDMAPRKRNPAPAVAPTKATSL